MIVWIWICWVEFFFIASGVVYYICGIWNCYCSEGLFLAGQSTNPEQSFFKKWSWHKIFAVKNKNRNLRFIKQSYFKWNFCMHNSTISYPQKIFLLVFLFAGHNIISWSCHEQYEYKRPVRNYNCKKNEITTQLGSRSQL